MHRFLIADIPANDEKMRVLVQTLRSLNIDFNYAETPRDLEEYFDDGDATFYPSRYHPDCAFTSNEAEVLRNGMIADTLASALSNHSTINDGIESVATSESTITIILKKELDSLIKFESYYFSLTSDDLKTVTIKMVAEYVSAIPIIVSQLDELKNR